MRRLPAPLLCRRYPVPCVVRTCYDRAPNCGAATWAAKIRQVLVRWLSRDEEFECCKFFKMLLYVSCRFFSGLISHSPVPSPRQPTALQGIPAMHLRLAPRYTSHAPPPCAALLPPPPPPPRSSTHAPACSAPLLLSLTCSWMLCWQATSPTRDRKSTRCRNNTPRQKKPQRASLLHAAPLRLMSCTASIDAKYFRHHRRRIAIHHRRTHDDPPPIWRAHHADARTQGCRLACSLASTPPPSSLSPQQHMDRRAAGGCCGPTSRAAGGCNRHALTLPAKVLAVLGLALRRRGLAIHAALGAAANRDLRL